MRDMREREMHEREAEETMRDVCMHEHEADYLYNGAVQEMLLDEGNMYVQEMRMRDMREREMHEREAEETLHDVSDFIYNGMGEIQAKDKALYHE